MLCTYYLGGLTKMKKELPYSLQKKDMVVISDKNLLDLFDWRDQNTDLVRNFTPILTDVVIKAGGVYVNIKKVENKAFNYDFTVYAMGQRSITIHWNSVTQKGNADVSEVFPYPDKKRQDEYSQSVISLYCSLMAYMEHYKEYVEAKEVRSISTNKKKGKKHNKKVTYIRKKVYTVPGATELKQKGADTESTRAYTKPTEPFKVHGHYRTYKNGNRVWVKPYVKNKKDNKDPEPTVYKL